MTPENKTLADFLESKKKEFERRFDWADQIKESEFMRWKMMYGFTPLDLVEDLVEERIAHDTRLLAFVREMIEKLPTYGIDAVVKNEYSDYVLKRDALSLLTPPTKV